jgi:hypothetical protein
MGVKITSLAQIPSDADIPFYVYLLHSHYPFEADKALDEAFEIIAQQAGERDFVVIQGLTREFGGEVMNAYSIDGIPEDEVLPAILISTVNPHRFEEVHSIDKSGPFRPRERVVLISLRQQHSRRDEVFGLLQKVIADIKAGRELRDFEVSKDKKTKFLDSLILQPNVSGVGIDFKALWSFLTGR